MNLNNIDYNMVDITALLCNQSSYVFAYIFLQLKYGNIDKGIILTNSSKNRNIRITTYPYITLHYEFVLHLKDSIHDTKLSSIFSNMFVDLESPVEQSLLLFEKFDLY